MTQANLGVNYRDAGRPTEGAHLIEEALERARRHPTTLANLEWAPKELAEAHDAAGQFASSEPLYRDFLEKARKQFGPSDPLTAGMMVSLAFNLLQQEKWAQAEPILRGCLAIRQRTQPDDWSTFNAQSLLGWSMIGQKKLADAEPLILEGYAGMKSREAMIPTQGKSRLADAGKRVVSLYEARGDSEQARQWRVKLGLMSPELPSDVFAR